MPVFEIPSAITECYIELLMNYLVTILPVIAISVVIARVIDTVVNGIVVKYSSDLLEGRSASINIGLHYVLLNLPYILVAEFVVSMLTVFGLIFFILPGIVIAIMFSLSVQVIIIEKMGVSEGLLRSRNLVVNRWLKTLTILFLVLMITLMSSVTGRIIGNSVAPYNVELSLLIESIISSVTKPLQPIVLTLLYYALRVREKTAEQMLPSQSIHFKTHVLSTDTQIPLLFQPKFCYKCGQSLPPDAIFCPRCGIHVKPE